MEHMILIVLIIISLAALALSIAAGFASYLVYLWFANSESKSLLGLGATCGCGVKKDSVPKSLDIQNENAESESDDAVPFDAEEALTEMNEWERALCEKQRQAHEIQRPGVAWKLTPGIYRQIRRAALRRI